MKKLLLHICCAPCLIVPYEHLSKEYQLISLWYNPFIQPYKEFLRRLDALELFEHETGAKIIYNNSYLLEEFFRRIVFRESQRCLFCYQERLQKTYIYAKKGQFDYFSTTLLQSHQQDRNRIVGIANSLTTKSGPQFLEFDFREDWKNGVEISKKMGLYRQQYCGCIYSEKDRYLKD